MGNRGYINNVKDRRMNYAFQRKRDNQLNLKDVLHHFKNQEKEEQKHHFGKPLYIKMKRRPYDYFDETVVWLSKMYLINNLRQKKMSVGDLVFLHVADGTLRVGIIWYSKKVLPVEEKSQFGGYYGTKMADKYSVVFRSLESCGDVNTANKVVYQPGGFRSKPVEIYFPHDEWMTDIIFQNLEPVHWWAGRDATTMSPQFKTMATLLNIHPSMYEELP